MSGNTAATTSAAAISSHHACATLGDTTAETLIDKALEVQYVGATYGAAGKPTPFICLVLKMLQISPELEIAREFLMAGDLKYLRAIAAFYVRLVAPAPTVYMALEPLYNDFRKLRVRGMGGWSITHMDELIHTLLTESSCFGVALPKLPAREVLEQAGKLGPYRSAAAPELPAFLEQLASAHAAEMAALQLPALQPSSATARVPRQHGHSGATASSASDYARHTSRPDRYRRRSRSRSPVRRAHDSGRGRYERRSRSPGGSHHDDRSHRRVRRRSTSRSPSPQSRSRSPRGYARRPSPGRYARR